MIRMEGFPFRTVATLTAAVGDASTAGNGTVLFAEKFLGG